MNISEERRAECVVLGLSGRLDATNSKTFEEKIAGAIAAGDRRFVLDLAQLEYVSSAGLRVFLMAAKRLSGVNGKLAVSGLNEHVRYVFDLAGFPSILNVYPSRDEALKQINAP